ncbi:MAG: beta galactosidase jelly roll domain-containing protein [Candidatus Omnitrophica bacterium]|nr:beta galactosidase jelly roll domain-containing protein [Candidatus Omnitrophota bacterium]
MKKNNALRRFCAGGLLLGICAWMHLGFVAAAGPEQKELNLVKENVVTDGRVKNLIDCEDASLWEGMVKANTEIKRSGKISFELYGAEKTELMSSRMIPVDLKKTYVLSAYLRTLDEQFPASAYFGLRMYDKNKKPITLANVDVIYGTETTLSADAPKGTKELWIIKTNNANWLNVTNAAVAFNAKNNFQDLPNFNLSPQIERVFNEGAMCRVVLKEQLTKAYPAGTAVRLHSPWGAPFYWVASGWIPSEWTKFSATISGEAQSKVPDDKFWRGTKYVRVFIWFANYDKIPQEGARLLADDITFLCGEKDIMEQQALSAVFRNPKITQEYNKRWHFQIDMNDEGLSAGWMKTDFSDKGWPFLDADRWWQEQGYPDYHGVAWYRKTFSPVRGVKGQKYFLYFGAVDGDASVFVNGRKIGEHTLLPDGQGWDKPFFFDCTDLLVSGKPNMIAVRVKKTVFMGGIFRGVKIIRADEVIRGG